MTRREDYALAEMPPTDFAPLPAALAAPVSAYLSAESPPKEQGADRQTADRVLTLLSILTASDRALSVRELAGALGKPLSTTYRYLGVLRDWELVAETLEGDGYVLGPRCLTLADAFRTQSTLGKATLGSLSLPVMQEVLEQTGETTLLLIPAAGRACCLESLESPHPLRYSFQKGVMTRTLFQGASTKAMLPYLNERQWQQAIAVLTPDADLAQLVTERERIRAQGYAQSAGEVDEGVVGIGSAILGRQGTLLGSLSIVMPSFRATEERCAEAVKTVRAAALRIGARAGSVPAPQHAEQNADAEGQRKKL
jgi:DNA-binding IclR family transcriptional regulator